MSVLPLGQSVMTSGACVLRARRYAALGMNVPIPSARKSPFSTMRAMFTTIWSMALAVTSFMWRSVDLKPALPAFTIGRRIDVVEHRRDVQIIIRDARARRAAAGRNDDVAHADPGEPHATWKARELVGLDEALAGQHCHFGDGRQERIERGAPGPASVAGTD